MVGNWLKLAAGCSVLLGIILFCVVFGGYSSFSRSQGRIDTSSSFLADTCQKRLDLLPGLVKITKNHVTQPSLEAVNKAAQKADLVLKQVISHQPPLDNNLIKEFESSQTELSLELARLFTQWETSPDKDGLKQFTPIKKQFYTIQDNLFVAKKRYNTEIAYFNTRTTLFPGFLIAKLFGFNKIKYPGISNDSFLPAQKTFFQGTL